MAIGHWSHVTIHEAPRIAAEQRCVFLKFVVSGAYIHDVILTTLPEILAIANMPVVCRRVACLFIVFHIYRAYSCL